MANFLPDRDKLRAGAAAVALQLALGYAILTGLGVELARRSDEPLTVFTVSPPARSRVEPPPPPKRAARPREEEGRAAPPALRATPEPIVAPIPIIPPPPPPVLAAPIASTGEALSAGAADVRGPGTSADGVGDGLGSGGDGTGDGGTGQGTPSRQIAGRIRDRDYPDAARRTGAQGSVIVDIHVDPRGRVARCGVYRSSGSPELDQGTCRLIAKRFRYEPARDAQGRPVADLRRWKQDWWRDLSYTARAR